MTRPNNLRADQVQPPQPQVDAAVAPSLPVPLRPLHTFGLESYADRLVQINSETALHAYANDVENGQSCLLLGEGSNTVFVSDAFRGTVYSMALKGRQYLGCESGRHRFRVMAGENWHQFVEWTVASGFPGLENLALIPGSVGASPVQNIGAYGLEMCEVTQAVHVFDLQTRQFSVMSAAECRFAYRDSIFKQELAGRCVITAVDFALPVEWTPRLEYGDVKARALAMGELKPINVMKSIIGIRTEKLPDPVCLGNAGSFFKNPIVPDVQFQKVVADHPALPSYPSIPGHRKLAAGWLIEQSGLKGFNLGRVGVYNKQALILVNLGGGQGSELLALIAHVQSTVKAKFGVELEAEPNLVW
jgi:UDP-N-acetylmuramate dehydrogenase